MLQIIDALCMYLSLEFLLGQQLPSHVAVEHLAVSGYE
jgi:hypothetical protein